MRRKLATLFALILLAGLADSLIPLPSEAATPAGRSAAPLLPDPTGLQYCVDDLFWECARGCNFTPLCVEICANHYCN